MKILNLYAGIGGNRKLWDDEHEITAVEYDPQIAAIYQDFFPNDTVIVTDAHQYLLDHFKEFDFIWASPPCPSHSRIRKAATHQNPPIFPDLKLYEEILFLEGYFNGKWVVENVIPWYKPLIPAKEMHRHLFWTNFQMTMFVGDGDRKHANIKSDSTIYGYNLSKYKISGGYNKVKILRNMVDPQLGLHIFKEAFTKTTLF